MASTLWKVLALVVVVAVAGVEGGEHHVVGGDHGWDPANDLPSWASLRTFRVGDTIYNVLSDGEGIRYFVSSNDENFKKGLKLHVDVIPQNTPEFTTSVSAPAAGPTPSGSDHLGLSFSTLLVGFFVYFVRF